MNSITDQYLLSVQCTQERVAVEAGGCKIVRFTSTLRVLLYELNILYILSVP